MSWVRALCGTPVDAHKPSFTRSLDKHSGNAFHGVTTKNSGKQTWGQIEADKPERHSE